MKKLVLFIVFILFSCGQIHTQIFAQDMGNTPGYSLHQNTPNPFKEITTIKFSLKEDCYVKLIALNMQTNKAFMIVEGELIKGDHGVIFKASNEMNAGSMNVNGFRCTMEVYSLNTNNLIYTSEILMQQK